MAIARVGTTTTGRGGAGTVTLSRTTVAGNAIILTIQHQNGNVGTVSDSAGNTYTAAGDTLSAGATSQRLVAIYYCLNAAATTSVTVTGTSVIQVLEDEWSGVGAIGATPAVASRASSTTPAAATVTGVTSGDLVYGCLAYVEAVAGTALETLTAGYTTTAHFDNGGGSTTAVAGGYSLTASGTTGPTWTMSSAASVGEVTVTFTPAATASTPASQTRREFKGTPTRRPFRPMVLPLAADIPVARPPRRGLKGLVVRRRTRAEIVPPQVVATPPKYVAPAARRGFKGWQPRRRTRADVVPPQVATTPPPYVPAVVRRGIKGLQPRRRTRAEVTPPQVAVAPPPTYVPTIPRKGLKGLTARRRPARVEAAHPHAGPSPRIVQKRTRPTPRPGRGRRPAELVPPQPTVAPPAPRRGLRALQPRRRTRLEVTPPQIVVTPPRYVPSVARRGFKGWQPRRRVMALLGLGQAAPVGPVVPYVELTAPGRLGTLTAPEDDRTLPAAPVVRRLTAPERDTLVAPPVRRTLTAPEV